MEAAPERIFIVRHAHRFDKENPDWGKGSLRPHDSMLSDQGKAAARKLGSFLRGARMIDALEVVILSSPLVRCVETAHCIAEGLTELNPSLLPKIPILIENSLCEGSYWMQCDMKRNRLLIGDLFPPKPMFYGPSFLKENVSPLVRVEQLNLGPSPVYCLGNDGDLREDISISDRCKQGAVGLLKAKQLFGKVVICVGHGETTELWTNAIVGKLHPQNNEYTGFAELMPQKAEGDEKNARFGYTWHHQSIVFGTPHLR